MFFLATTLHFKLFYGLIRYDCGQKFTNFTTFSLVNIRECDLPEPIVNVTKLEISLLQINEYADTLVRYYKVEIKRTVVHCGMWSHISNVKNREVKYLREVSREECDRMQSHKSIYIADTPLNGLRINDSITHPLTFAGAFKTDGSR